MKQVILFIFLLALLSSCGGKSKSSSVIEAEKAIPLRYAENLSLSATEDYTIARLRNPWDTTRILHTYVLVDKEKSLPADLPEGTLVRTPLSKAVVYSSVHCGLLNQIGALKSIGGVCDLKYIKLQEVQDGCRTGSIVDVGNGMNPDIEKIIDLHPDAIMLSPLRTVADTDGWRNSTSPLSNVQTTWKLQHWDVPNGCVSTVFCSVRHKKRTTCLPRWKKTIMS